VRHVPSDAVYVTLLGRSGWGVLNAYYAVVREGRFIPGEIHVFTEGSGVALLESVKEGLARITEAFGGAAEIRSTEIPDADFVEAGRQISALIRTCREQGSRVAIDITSGRKALVVGALVPLRDTEVDHIFYLDITTTEGNALPYMMIPLPIQRLRDFARYQQRGQA